jgi:hypothetical protein
MNSWDRQMASLSPAQKNRYNQFLNTIPSELQGLSAANMQKYLQGVDEKQNALAHERAGYESQIKKIQNDETQRQAQLLEAKEMQRPWQWASSGFTAGHRWGRYKDGSQNTIPFNLFIKKLTNRNSPDFHPQYSDPEFMRMVYRGYGRLEDPYRPFKWYPNGFHYLMGPTPHTNTLPVPDSVIEKYKSKGNFRNAWYPMLEDT